jgi:hypothetical protein
VPETDEIDRQLQGRHSSKDTHCRVSRKKCKSSSGEIVVNTEQRGRHEQAQSAPPPTLAYSQSYGCETLLYQELTISTDSCRNRQIIMEQQIRQNDGTRDEGLDD